MLREFLPPAACVLISLLIHVLVVVAEAHVWPTARKASVDTVVIDLVDPQQAKLPDFPEAVAAQTPPPRVEPPAPAPQAAPESAKAPVAPKQPTPPEAKATFAPPSSVPDPTAPNAGEVTLPLDTADARYQGYLERVRATIDRHWRWREGLLAAGKPGVVVLRVTFERSGGKARADLRRGSGSVTLDANALETFQSAIFPPFPPHWTVERLNLVGEFEYRLE
jgi:TonB family protein